MPTIFFTVLSIYDVFKDEAELMKFLPDLSWSKKLPNRQYVVEVVSSLKPVYVRRAIEHAEALWEKEGW